MGLAEDACTLDVLLAAGHPSAVPVVVARMRRRLRALEGQLSGLEAVLPPSGSVSVSALARVAGCARSTVRAAVVAGELRVVGEGSETLIDRASAVAWLASRS